MEVPLNYKGGLLHFEGEMAHKQNYLERMERNKQRKLESGLISERFPEVSDIVVHMTYYQKAVNPVLMSRTINFWPTHHAYFNMDCMKKDCVDGGFDLTSVIINMIKHQKKSAKGKLNCHGSVIPPASEHASIDYEITIKYNKK
ncbi:MAG: hypothetical protein H6Q92_747 [Nitrospirae bacterium]|nr:hypothetical protein [Nitrospirota bacterium]